MNKLTMVAVVAAILLVVGCSGQGDTPREDQAGSRESKTVVVNEGMSKKEEEKLNERLAELEDEVNDRSAEDQPVQESESAEDSVRSAAQDYYAAAADGHYLETYSELDSDAQGQFTEDEWVAANAALGSDAASYSVNSVNMVDDSTAEVYLTISSPDGSTSERFTRFVLEDGSWKHELTQEEYDLFAGASGATATATLEPTTVEPEETDLGEDLSGNEQYESFVPAPGSDDDRNRGGTRREGASFAPISEDDCPARAPIKGNRQSDIYHEPGDAFYDETDPEECFATPADAEAAGYRASKV